MKLHARKLLVAVCLLILAFTLVAPLLAQTQEAFATVNTGQLNVRSGPGLQYGAITTLPYGFGVRMIGRNTQQNWVLIQLTTGLQGWVNVNYLRTNYRISDLPIADSVLGTAITPTGRITGAFNVNVRSAPDANASIVGVATLDQALTLLGRNFNASWAQVRLDNGTTGWVSSQFVAGTVPVRSLAPTDGSVVGPPVAAPGPRIHVVQPGETLGTIAQRYDTTIYALAAANGISNINVIYSGQRLVIP
jgi:uncharacterized protein YraI